MPTEPNDGGAAKYEYFECPACGEERDPEKRCPNFECQRLPERLVKALLAPYRNDHATRTNLQMEQAMLTARTAKGEDDG